MIRTHSSKTCTLQTQNMQISAIKTHTTKFTPYTYMKGLSKLTMDIGDYEIQQITPIDWIKVDHLDTILGMSSYHHTIGYPIYTTVTMAVLMVISFFIYVKWKDIRASKEIKEIISQTISHNVIPSNNVNAKMVEHQNLYPGLPVIEDAV